MADNDTCAKCGRVVLVDDRSPLIVCRHCAQEMLCLLRTIEWLNDQLQVSTKQQLAFRQAVEAVLFGGTVPKDVDVSWLQQLARRVNETVRTSMLQALREALAEISDDAMPVAIQRLREMVKP